MMLWFDLAVLLVVLGVVAICLTFGIWKETGHVGFTAVPLISLAVGEVTCLITVYAGWDMLAGGFVSLMATLGVLTVGFIGGMIIEGIHCERRNLTAPVVC